ncbi:MAG: hypothetical protein Q9164_000955 [Protoblastenia rupestris]
MASVKSLGVHKPSALSFLISEGILPPNPSEDAYNWRTFEQRDQGEGVVEEELITTNYCVVWSKGGVIERIFHFDVEKEAITKAVFTNFTIQTPSDQRPHVTSPTEDDETKDSTIGELKVRKIRGPKVRSTSRSGSAAPIEDKSEKPIEIGAYREPPSRRALVVVLKTQAHVFLISETSHVVHLPFEVDSIFPSFLGLILQRKSAEQDVPQPTPVLPAAPQNTFSYSQSSATDPASSLPNETADLSGPNSPFASSLRKLQTGSSKSASLELPRLFCLIDPLTEVGIVVAREGSRSKKHHNSKHSHSSAFTKLDPNERLLYVSPEDEIVHSQTSPSRHNALILAVTENHVTQSISVWNVTSIDQDTSISSRTRTGQSLSGNVSHRRSSLATRLSTGATTPVAKSHRHVSRDPTFEDDRLQEHEALLDSAFENPAVLAKSSRRVSSLLARADLSTTHDKTSFTDLAAGHHGARNSRRGPSFSTRASHAASDIDLALNPAKLRPLRDVRSSLDSISLHDQQLDDVSSDHDDIHHLKSMNNDLGFHDATKGLQKEILFQKVYSVSNQSTRHYQSSKHNRSHIPHVFTMQAPGPVGHGNKTIVMCVMNRLNQELLILQIKATSQSSSLPNDNTYTFRVTGTRRSEVTDACFIGHGPTSRILVLDGKGGALTLQAPWTTLMKVDLPTPLMLHDPYQIITQASPRQKREGGLKRVISQGPKGFATLEHATRQGSTDIVDFDGTRHRIQIQFNPSNHLVSRMIRFCESVLPASEADGEAMLRGWWDAMIWLRARSEPEPDTEWTAMLVLLFSMGVMFMDDFRAESTPRQKRRKGALLRSSSGANADLDSWDTMFRHESSLSSTCPEWMKHGAWQWTVEEVALPSPLSQRSRSSGTMIAAAAVPIPSKSPRILHCISLARDFVKSPLGQTATGRQGYLPTASSRDPDVRRTALATVLVALHLLREELKLNIMAMQSLHQLTPILAQMGSWLGWQNWSCGESSYYTLESTDMAEWLFDDSTITGLKVPPEPFPPPSIMKFIEATHVSTNLPRFTTLLDVAGAPIPSVQDPRSSAPNVLLLLTPRTFLITSLLTPHIQQTVDEKVSKMTSWGIDLNVLETMPEGIASPFRTAMAACQARPSTDWSGRDLQMIGRDDIAMLETKQKLARGRGKMLNTLSTDATRDVHSICNLALDVDTVGPYDGSAEIDRQSITRLIFKEDQRFAEAAKLVHPLHYPVAKCVPEPGWSEQEFLEAQQELAKTVALRTLSVSLGRGLLFYSARLPSLTEKFPVHGFTLSCVMKPSDTTVTADRATFTEEKVSWAFFHAGVEAGLSISKDAKGVDTSWILFNKPRELTNRHAGFLLALGLNGHLRSIAKWAAFKYLTPKHNMTSIGLLLGLSASYLGTMDTLVTRLLSIHVTRMLPPGAAELNLSPLTQTCGIMGIGLLYFNTQHRRMSEIMLSEMENVDQEDSSNPLDTLRDEGYRLAAGSALGFINVGRGKNLKGLHDMHITERLLTLAIATKRVDVVHIADKATTGATIAIALIFMKTNDEPLARKIDIPDTTHQFDYVRPDQFLLRTVAKQLIMWDSIKAEHAWITSQLPRVYQNRVTATIRSLTSEDLPYFNVLAGLCLSIGLRYAGSGSLEVRDILCTYLDHLVRICRLPALSYDGKVARITVRNCQDVVALSVSCVMAGTGDLVILRRLRSLHGRTDADTPYGSHLAAHFAVGVLFLGGGTHTFGTSSLAIASLLCAFYPLFPASVLDNKSHLQAFRHFWVLATERRCLVPRDIDTHRALSLAVIVSHKDGTTSQHSAPCLLPDLSTISAIHTADPEYWPITLSFASNPNHLSAFNRHQSIYLRRRNAYDASHTSVFSATMRALNDTQTAHQLRRQPFEWIFTLPSFRDFDRAERALVLPVDPASGLNGGVYLGTRETVVDDRLAIETGCLGDRRSEKLWNLRILLKWAEECENRGEQMGWLGRETVERLRARLALWARDERES